ncbi:MAG: molybdopterin molybdotransferase MoeA [Bacteroidales bacterium]|nr:molybdopterin molybdotransferase MoeA [Lentimicrobiaceae bacterium]MDD5694803.1 molybdopterin molybdotransferase MoeA [Bacteroidales bacterium]
MKMVSFEEAYHRVLSSAYEPGIEHLPLQDALHRILAEDVVSDTDIPPFDKSAVDGFACRRADLGRDLECIETIPAGVVPKLPIQPGQCSRIMTGSIVPEGADMVMMVEDTMVTAGERIRFIKEKSAGNICYRAEDIHQGDVVLRAGSLIRPQEIAVMASVGWVSPAVYLQPRVGVISTGDELVEPDHVPMLSQIRNSNASQLLSQLNALGIRGTYFGIARDDRESLKRILENAKRASDVVLLTGGVSMGAFDHVPDVLTDLNITLIFKSIAIQPGRPTVFGMSDGRYFFGLPGNPVSSFVIFELLIKPMLYKLMGHTFSPLTIGLPMAEAFARKRSDRKSYLPVTVRDGRVHPVVYHGSAHIHSYIFADGIMALETGQIRIHEGEIVNVRQI